MTRDDEVREEIKQLEERLTKAEFALGALQVERIDILEARQMGNDFLLYVFIAQQGPETIYAFLKI